MGSEFTLKGFDEILNALDELEPKVAKKWSRKSCREGAKIIQKETKATAPVGETGELKKGVKVQAAPRSRKAVGVDVKIGERDHVGDLHYAAKKEFGTSKMPASHFMRDAFDRKKEEAKNRMMEVLAQGIEQSIRELAR